MPGSGKVCRPGAGKSSPGRESRGVTMARLMRSQAWVIGLRQLQALGYSADEVAGFVVRGALWRVHRGVYADTRAPMAPRGHLVAAVLAVTPGAVPSRAPGAFL